MPCLNPDILFDIGKKLVEDGIQEEVYKFAFSGKETFHTMKRIFASVTFLHFYSDRYVIGWENPCCTFEFNNGRPHSKFLMSCIGNSVTNLRINCLDINIHREMFQPILDNIIAKKQLTEFSLSLNTFCGSSFLDNFLPQFSSTLKHVSIPSALLTQTFRDSFNLVSLNIIDSFHDRLLLFCCKTESLILTFGNPLSFQSFDNFVLKYQQISPALLSIKQLIFEHTVCFHELNDGGIGEVMEYFPSLESLKFIVPWERELDFLRYNSMYTKFIKNVIKIPPKVVIELWRYNNTVKFLNPDNTGNNNPVELGFDESIADFYCYRKNVQSAGPESTILEIQIPK